MANELAPAEKKLALRTQKAQVLVAGGVLGALVGVGAAYLILQSRAKRSPDAEEDAPLVTSGGMFKIGMLVFGLLRSIGDVARGE